MNMCLSKTLAIVVQYTVLGYRDKDYQSEKRDVSTHIRSTVCSLTFHRSREIELFKSPMCYILHISVGSGHYILSCTHRSSQTSKQLLQILAIIA